MRLPDFINPVKATSVDGFFIKSALIFAICFMAVLVVCLVIQSGIHHLLHRTLTDDELRGLTTLMLVMD